MWEQVSTVIPQHYPAGGRGRAGSTPQTCPGTGLAGQTPVPGCCLSGPITGLSRALGEGGGGTLLGWNSSPTPSGWGHWAITSFL